MTTIKKSFSTEKAAVKYLNKLYNRYNFVEVAKAPIGAGEYVFNVKD